ncbi:uncharacterized protein [Dysidea avara]
MPVGGISGSRLSREDENSQLNLLATVGRSYTRAERTEEQLLPEEQPEEQLDCDSWERVVQEHRKFQKDLSTKPRNVLPLSSIINRQYPTKQFAKVSKQSAGMNSAAASSSGQDVRPDKEVKELAVSKPDDNSGRIVKVPHPQFLPPGGLSARSQFVTGLNNLTANSYDTVLMYSRHKDVNSRMLTVKSVFGTDSPPLRGRNGAATQGCINPGYSSQQVKLHTIPEVGSPWKPVEINLGRCVTSMSRPWYSQADMCMLPQDLENNTMEPL